MVVKYEHEYCSQWLICGFVDEIVVRVLQLIGAIVYEVSNDLSLQVHKFDIIYFSETYLDSSIPVHDNNLEISGYNLIRSDHPSNNKRGGVCIYYKNFLPLRVCGISFLDECINFELKIGDKLCCFVAFYRSASQTQDDFLSFSENFELTLERL